jgi:hypothetical protein
MERENIQRHTPEDEHASKMEAIAEDYRRKLEIAGGLSPDEIEELVILDVTKGPETVSEQVRRYYLKLKTRDRDKAEQMLSEVGDINDDTIDEEGVQKIVRVLNGYISGFVINLDGEAYHREGTGFSSMRNKSSW